ncbi:universal stress protein [Asinibacterium sp. OR53]|uniref:universal stress protein n=1 Tax=Asinibacterium sp. OR53 TaxID=925409 RepID=UPI00047D3B6B|nr:universal stress protein [Asinibacterium sp. OR53]
MNKILIPTDFSATATNAALYALGLAKQVGVKSVVLYNAYQSPVTIDPMMPTVQLFDIDELKKNSEEALDRFRSQLKEAAGTISLETFSAFNVLSEGLDSVCQETGADLIVMGISGAGGVEETLIGSNAVSVARHSTYPVIIVPAQASFVPIQEVLFACDYKKVVETTPVGSIKSLLSATGARLSVLNVYHNKEYDDTFTYESLMLDTLLEGCRPHYFFVDNPDFTDAINAFVKEKHSQIVITIPKKHGWFEGLFHKSHTRMLAFHSIIPLMVIHE